MRLFTSVPVPGHITEKLAALQPELSRYLMARQVKPENMHLTLKFFGKLDDSLSEKLIQSLSALSQRPFKVEVSGIRCVPKSCRPRIVWAGCTMGSRDLRSLHGQIESACKEFGLEPDKRFHPHITLARVKSVTDLDGLKSFLYGYSGKAFGSFDARCFHLVNSRLTPNGPVYSLVHEFGLG